MGIAVLAAGGSIPEATSGIINARNGKEIKINDNENHSHHHDT